MNGATLTKIDELTGGRIGTFDVACPWCGPERRVPARIWPIEQARWLWSCRQAISRFPVQVCDVWPSRSSAGDACRKELEIGDL
jgi:hypothetical protein